MITNFLRKNIKLILTSTSILISFLVIIGWFIESDFILIYFADNAGMKFNTALFFLIISTILFTDQLQLNYPYFKKIALFIILILSGYTLAEYIFSITLNIDNLVVSDNYNLKLPGRMSIGTVVCFMLLSTGLILQDIKNRYTILYGQNLFAIIIIISSISSITHILNIPNENKSMFLDTMSIITSVLFLALSFISNFKNKSVGIFSVFFTDFTGSKILKKLIFVVIFIPIILSYFLILGVSDSFIKTDFGIVLHTVLLIVITFGSITYLSNNLNRTDSNRRMLEKDLKKSNKELLRINNKLIEKNKELEQFVYIASHDLQEPLRTVTSISEMLEDEYKTELDDNAKTYINFIKEGVGRMHSLVRDLMDYSRLGSKLEFGLVDFNLVLNNTLNDLSLKIKESKAEIKHDVLPIINANESAIRQLFQNLISNGIKFRKKNIVPKIEINVDDNDEFWTIHVKDNGIGVDPKNHDKIFKIFKRLHLDSEFPGTGIGLANCKKIVELHKGKIWITSNLNEGTTIHVTLKK